MGGETVEKVCIQNIEFLEVLPAETVLNSVEIVRSDLLSPIRGERIRGSIIFGFRRLFRWIFDIFVD